MMISDHGFLRLLYHNFFKIDDNIYRCNMPTPQRIRKYKNVLGIKTIINCRGTKRDGGWLLESEACEKYDIELINLNARSRAAPDKELIMRADEMFKRIKYPALIHCKSGADRAGIVSALYKLLYCKESPKNAKKQLSLKFLHIKHAKTGILDKFIEEYENFLNKNKNKNFHFLDWVQTIYKPEKLEHDFRSNSFMNNLLFKILRRE